MVSGRWSSSVCVVPLSGSFKASHGRGAARPRVCDKAPSAAPPRTNTLRDSTHTLRYPSSRHAARSPRIGSRPVRTHHRSENLTLGRQGLQTS